MTKDPRRAEQVPVAQRAVEFPLSHPPYAWETLADIVENPKQLNLLREVTNSYHSRFESVERLCELMSQYTTLESPAPNVTFLLDFDILRSYIESDVVSDSSSGIARSLVDYSNVALALPWGSVLELLAYFSMPQRAIEIASCFPEAEWKDPETLTKAVVQSLSVPESGADIDSWQELATRTPELARLAQLVTSPRFKGVVTQRYTHHLKGWLVAVSRLQRGRKRARDFVDECDAANLAIATSSAFGGEQLHVLLTRTSGIKMLAKDARHDDILSHVAEELGYEGGVQFAVEFPVFDPVDVLICELLGGLEAPHLARRVAFTRLEHFAALTRTIGQQQQIINARLPRAYAGYDHNVVSRLAEQLRLTAEHLQSSTEGLREIEIQRASLVSLELMRRKQIMGRLLSTRDMLRRDSLPLIRHLGELFRPASSSIRYQILWGAEGDRFEVRAAAGALLLDGWRDDHAGIRRCSLHWSTTALDRELIEGLREGWGQHPADEGTVNCRAWVEASEGVYEVPLPDRNPEDALDLGNLGRLVAKLAAPIALPSGRLEPAGVRSMSIEICGTQILFQIDLDEEDNRRAIVLTCDKDISPSIVALYLKTGVDYADRAALTSALRTGLTKVLTE
jgi:hypothetical protein